MFSKALYKQSWKANGIMWSIITFAVCFMLACVMLISGSGSIGNMKQSIEDTIITGEIDAQMESRSINYYSIATDGEQKFDEFFVKNFKSVKTYDALVTNYLTQKLSGVDAEFPTPQQDDNAQGLYALATQTWLQSMPTDPSALATWQTQRPNTNEQLVTYAYKASLANLQKYEQEKALQINENYVIGSDESNEIVGASICTVDPTANDTIKELYTNNNETLPSMYDVNSLLAHITEENDAFEYRTSDERLSYLRERAQNSSAVYLAGNMTTEKNKTALINALSSYGVTPEKYETFGYTFSSINHTAQTTIVSYQGRFDYELDLINKKYTPEQRTSEAYLNEVKEMNEKLTKDLSNSLLDSLPKEVSDALEEVGQMDLYSLIVGSIFYKMAGLLLPIIYMIMVANNLIAGQVDSGSMAYVLSTSTKRKQVVFTQATFLVTSLLAMFTCTTITSAICLSIVKTETITLTYSELILLNVGAFVTMFALSGISFLASCWFNRSKYSMSIGGGLNMFFLVATMLGLFGSKVLPSVVRLSALNFFNYTSLISLFDVISILDGTTAFIWKFAILIVVGLICYIVGSIKFQKKDLPL